jgi:hypothetical protein
LSGESGSGDSRSALTAVQAEEIVHAGLHRFFSTSRQISPVYGKRIPRNDYLEVYIRMTYRRLELDVRRDIRISLWNNDFQQPFAASSQTQDTMKPPSYDVPEIPRSHPLQVNRFSSLTGERLLTAGLGSFDSLENSFKSLAAVEWLIASDGRHG